MISGKILLNNYIWVKKEEGWRREIAPDDHKAPFESKAEPAPKELFDEIKEVGCKRNDPQQREPYLQHVATYYANRALPNMHGLQIHGFPVLVSRPRSVKFNPPQSSDDDHYKKRYIDPRLKTRACYATAFYASNHELLAPVSVTKSFLKAAQKSEPAIKPLMLKALTYLENERFNSVENFIRCLLIKRNELIDELTPSEVGRQKKIPLENIYLFAANPFDIANRAISNDLQQLINLNNELFSHLGAVFPYMHYDSFNRRDGYALEDGDVVAKELPDISATTVLEVRQQYLLHRYWTEARAGIGNSYSLCDALENEAKLSDAEMTKKLTAYKQTVSSDSTKKIMQGLVMFSEVAWGQQPLVANCNKSTATFLQACENLEAAKKQRPAIRVTGVSKTCFGSNSRMRFWQPVPIQPATAKPQPKQTNDEKQQHKKSF